MLGERLKTPEGAASFFAACGYTRTEIAEYLETRLGMSREVAQSYADDAVGARSQQEEEDGRKDAQYAAAHAAEFDLSRRTWG